MADSYGGEAHSPFFIIFTDLDGTLLDNVSYSWKEAESAVEECKRHSIPIVLVTSKTRAELMVLREALCIFDPFVTENGGGVFFPKKRFNRPPEGADSVDGLWRWSLGVPYSRLVKAFEDMAQELGWKIKGFSQMTPQEISRLTGLSIDEAIRAAQREYDEPFLILDKGNAPELDLFEAAKRRNLHITKGGRFYHLHGRSDKGRATKSLIELYRKIGHNVFSIGVGDSENDLPMLEVVDLAIFVGNPQTLNDAKGRVQDILVPREKGPKGWNQAILNFLKTREEYVDVK